MKGITWPLVEFASRLLETEERDAVLGDLLEAGESAWQGLLDVLGLIARRHAGFWKGQRPWFAGFIVAPSCGYLLTTVSLSVSCTYTRLMYPNGRISICWPTGHEGFLMLLCHILLLIGWSWAAGYVLGFVSRVTLWASAALLVVPAVVSVFRHSMLPPSEASYFLFVVPAIWGGVQALRRKRVARGAAFAVAVAVTGLMLFAWNDRSLWIMNWALLLPVWYVVAKAWRPGQERQAGPWPMGEATYTS
jgi:hypothetical protein